MEEELDGNEALHRYCRDSDCCCELDDWWILGYRNLGTLSAVRELYIVTELSLIVLEACHLTVNTGRGYQYENLPSSL